MFTPASLIAAATRASAPGTFSTSMARSIAMDPVARQPTCEPTPSSERHRREKRGASAVVDRGAAAALAATPAGESDRVVALTLREVELAHADLARLGVRGVRAPVEGRRRDGLLEIAGPLAALRRVGVEVPGLVGLGEIAAER